MTDTTEVDADRHVYGAVDAPVTLVEYGDFECPYCGAAAPILRRVVDGSGGRVRLVFRHFPIFQAHPFALTAALAAEAARDHFWAMHDLLLANQTHLTDADLRAYAERVGAGDVVGAGAQEGRRAVEADYARGVEAGVRGTPTLFIDGRRYMGRVEAAPLRAVLGVS